MKKWKIEHNQRCMELSLLAIESRFDPLDVLNLMFDWCNSGTLLSGNEIMIYKLKRETGSGGSPVFDETVENQRESGIIEAR